MKRPLLLFPRRPAPAGVPNARAARRASTELPTDDLELIAQRVAQVIMPLSQPLELVDAGELARRFGVKRTWVYDHAEMLGAIRLGSGPKARLRFDPVAVAAALLAPEVQRRPPSRPAQPRRRRAPAAEKLLPIRGRTLLRRMRQAVRRPRRD